MLGPGKWGTAVALELEALLLGAIGSLRDGVQGSAVVRWGYYDARRMRGVLRGTPNNPRAQSSRHYAQRAGNLYKLC